MADDQVESAINLIFSQKNYPCVAALRSFNKKDYQLKIYDEFGKKYQRPELREDLLAYKVIYQKTKSPYFTFWAVFKNSGEMNEAQFESRLWSELSSLTSLKTKTFDKDPDFSNNPEDHNFCFSLEGMAFFVVGLHPESSRKARRFPWPALIFNVYEQFRQLDSQGLYHPMIETNRERDFKFQGCVNPMVERHHDAREAIQFSGQVNPDHWKCPFQFR